MSESARPSDAAAKPLLRAGARRIKVCIVGLRGVPAIMGGVEAHCEQLYPRLRHLMPEAEFEIIGRRAYTGPEAYEYQGIRVTPLGGVEGKYFEALSHTFVAILYARFKAHADLIHIHAIGPGVLAPLAKLLGMRTVVTHHGKDYLRQKWNRFAKALLAAGEWLSVMAAERTVVVSGTLAQELARRYPARADHIVYVPNGMPASSGREGASEADEAVLQRFGLAKNSYVLAVGRLVPEKGFHDLIAAFDAAPATLKLVIAGAADHTDRYSQALLAQASERIVFTGFQDHGTLGALYRNAGLFVLPSYHEGLPIVVLEAARYGAPILISDISANLDIGLEPGNYFPVGDVSALRGKLAGGYDGFNVDVEAISRQFDWDLIAQRTAAVYRDCRGPVSVRP
jgi:glycosyltransferase involved in cell wall biosynthesis